MDLDPDLQQSQLHSGHYVGPVGTFFYFDIPFFLGQSEAAEAEEY
jgi:hypothetical protein